MRVKVPAKPGSWGSPPRSDELCFPPEADWDEIAYDWHPPCRMHGREPLQLGEEAIYGEPVARRRRREAKNEALREASARERRRRREEEQREYKEWWERELIRQREMAAQQRERWLLAQRAALYYVAMQIRCEQRLLWLLRRAREAADAPSRSEPPRRSPAP